MPIYKAHFRVLIIETVIGSSKVLKINSIEKVTLVLYAGWYGLSLTGYLVYIVFYCSLVKVHWWKFSFEKIVLKYFHFPGYLTKMFCQ